MNLSVTIEQPEGNAAPDAEGDLGELRALHPNLGHKKARSDVKITEMAELAGTTIRALRYYEQIGLVQPGRSDGNARVYGPVHRVRVAAIVALRSLGVAVEDIRVLLDGEARGHGASETLAGVLDARLKALQRQSADVLLAMKTLRLLGQQH